MECNFNLTHLCTRMSPYSRHPFIAFYVCIMIFQGFLIGNLLKYKYEYKGLLKYTHSVSCEIFVKFSNGKLMIDKKFQFFVKFFSVVSTHRQLITKVAFSELTQRRVIHRRNCPRSRKTLNMNVILSSFHGSSFDYFRLIVSKTQSIYLDRTLFRPDGNLQERTNSFVRSSHRIANKMVGFQGRFISKVIEDAGYYFTRRA